MEGEENTSNLYYLKDLIQEHNEILEKISKEIGGEVIAAEMAKYAKNYFAKQGKNYSFTKRSYEGPEVESMLLYQQFNK